MPEDKPRRFRDRPPDKGKAEQIALAIESLPKAKERFLNGLPEGFTFHVTILLTDGLGRAENAFVRVTKWDSNEISGSLATELNLIRAHRKGESLRFPDSRVIDWMILAPDGSEEGNFIGKYFDSLLYCKTPGCVTTPFNFVASVARAHLEADLLADPKATFKFDCSICSQTTSFTMQELTALIPVKSRPRPCPKGEFWAFVLMEIPLSGSKADGANFGEPVYCYLLQETGTEWQAKCLSASKFLQPLGVNDLLSGTKKGGFNIVTGVLREGRREPLPLVSGLPKNSEFAVFFIDKQDPKGLLRPASLFCSNPICSYPFRMTHTEWLHNCQKARQSTPDLVDLKYESSITCPRCGTSRMVNENSFHGMVLL